MILPLASAIAQVRRNVGAGRVGDSLISLVGEVIPERIAPYHLAVAWKVANDIRSAGVADGGTPGNLLRRSGRRVEDGAELPAFDQPGNEAARLSAQQLARSEGQFNRAVSAEIVGAVKVCDGVLGPPMGTQCS